MNPNLFGAPGTGIHSFRICNIAVADVLFTILLAFGLWKFFHWNFLMTLVGLFLLGILVHRLVGVRTTVDKLLFPDAVGPGFNCA